MNNRSLDEMYNESVDAVKTKKQRVHQSDKELFEAQQEYLESVLSAGKMREKAEKEKKILIDIVKAAILIVIYVVLSAVNEWFGIIFVVGFCVAFAVYKFFGDKIKAAISGLCNISFTGLLKKFRTVIFGKIKNISFDDIKNKCKKIFPKSFFRKYTRKFMTLFSKACKKNGVKKEKATKTKQAH